MIGCHVCFRFTAFVYLTNTLITIDSIRAGFRGMWEVWSQQEAK